MWLSTQSFAKHRFTLYLYRRCRIPEMIDVITFCI